MPGINQLSEQATVQSSDQFPIYSPNNGQPRKVSANAIREFVLEGPDAAPVLLPNGISDISSLFAMRIASPVAVSVGTSFANIPNYSQSFSAPDGRTSFTANITLGEFVAARDVDLVMFYVALTGTWPTNRDLTLAVLVGPDSLPFESAFQFIGAGRGGSAPVTAAFGGPTSNLNSPGGTILAGEKVRLVARFNTADTLNIERLSFVVQTLDGI